MDGTGDTIDHHTTDSQEGGATPVEIETGPMDWRAHPQRGRGLRLVLTDELRRRPTTTVAELVAALRDQGFRVGPVRLVLPPLDCRCEAGPNPHPNTQMQAQHPMDLDP